MTLRHTTGQATVNGNTITHDLNGTSNTNLILGTNQVGDKTNIR